MFVPLDAERLQDAAQEGTRKILVRKNEDPFVCRPRRLKELDADWIRLKESTLQFEFDRLGLLQMDPGVRQQSRDNLVDDIETEIVPAMESGVLHSPPASNHPGIGEVFDLLGKDEGEAGAGRRWPPSGP